MAIRDARSHRPLSSSRSRTGLALRLPAFAAVGVLGLGGALAAARTGAATPSEPATDPGFVEGRWTLQVEDGEPIDEMLDEARIRTRRFARRQMKWFGRDPRIDWIDLDAGGSVRHDQAIEQAIARVSAA